VSIAIQAVWLLCGIAAAVFSTGAAQPRRIVVIVAGFGLAGWLFRGGYPPDTATVAGLAAIVAGCGIYRPGWLTLPAFFGGFFAAVLAALLETQGVPEPIALLSSALIPCASVALASRRSAFAPAGVLEEGRLLVLAFGLGSAVVPAILDGWRSAGALNGAIAANQAMPAWVLSVTGVSILIGCAWSIWRHQ
jgi:hypothetical protein